jgi:hypothetical protein
VSEVFSVEAEPTARSALGAPGSSITEASWAGILTQGEDVRFFFLVTNVQAKAVEDGNVRIADAV